ncbi:MAG TPA: 50S ribosomal protein L4 [Candidatus Polarisedimenticolia bacterium]|nr:50S ribosomal protein L4 [Candidatus Polarisedimenticolia bacterium]
MPKIAILSLQGGKKGKSIELPDDVYAAPVNTYLLHEAVIAFQAAGRAGTHSTKTRTQVSGGGKKPWKQKKTGRARAASIRSPLWRGGGTVHGPEPRDYTQALPRKKRQGALRSVLSAKVRDGKLMVVDSLEIDNPKSKDLVAAAKGLGLKGSAIFVDEPLGRNLELSSRNVPQYKAARSTALNVVDLMRYDTVVLTEAAVKRVAEVLAP